MYLLIMLFSIPNKKVYEFNRAWEELVKWPIYVLHNIDIKSDEKIFELIRIWNSKEEMNREISSHICQNLIGIVNVLGTIKSSELYSVAGKQEFFINQEY